VGPRISHLLDGGPDSRSLYSSGDFFGGGNWAAQCNIAYREPRMWCSAVTLCICSLFTDTHICIDDDVNNVWTTVLVIYHINLISQECTFIIPNPFCLKMPVVVWTVGREKKNTSGYPDNELLLCTCINLQCWTYGVRICIIWF